MAIQFISIGTSLGGVNALTKLFSYLPDNFEVPIAVVLHRAPAESDHLINLLQKSTTIKIQEATDKLLIANRRITLAPADYHLMVDNGHFALSVEAPVKHARPSIDVFFESVATQYASTALGIILTGGGIDGICGLQKIKTHNGSVLVQSPATAQDATLPQAAIDAGLAFTGYPIDQLVARLLQQCRPKAA